jgi:hypothetical protein
MAPQPSTPQYPLGPLETQGFLLLLLAHLLANLYVYGKVTMNSFSTGIIGHFSLNLAIHVINYLLIAKSAKRFFLRTFPACTYPRLMVTINTILLAHGIKEAEDVVLKLLVAVFFQRGLGNRFFGLGKEKWVEKVVEVVDTVTVDAKEGAAKATRSVAAEAEKVTDKIKEAISKVAEEVGNATASAKDEL